MNRAAATPYELPLRYAQFVQGAGVEYSRQVLQFTAEYYSRLLRATFDYGQQVAEAFANPSPVSVKALPAEAPGLSRTQTELHFAHRTEGVLPQEFVIANKQGCEIPVRFEVSEFVSGDSKTRTHAAVEFEPHEFVLQPGDEQVVQCRIAAGPELASDEVQVALARVVGFPDMMLRLVLAPALAASLPVA